MLSRTADDVFWAARYVERAENLARLLEVADRMSMMPAEANNSQEWMSVLTAGGVEPEYLQTHDDVTPESAVDFIAFDQNNPSSIQNCIRAARENVRAQRHAVTREFWEAINGAWQTLRDRNAETVAEDGLSNFIDDVKRSSHLVRGAMAGTMIRDDLYRFIRLGTFMERADSTARILDVKYHVVLPARKPMGGATDYYHWTALLQSVSAHGSYRRIFGEAVESRRVAELLTVRPEMPRSIRACYDEIVENLEALSRDYGVELKSLRLAGRLYSELRYNTVEEIITSGLHEFLTDLIERNYAVVEQFQRDFLLIPAEEEAAT